MILQKKTKARGAFLDLLNETLLKLQFDLEPKRGHKRIVRRTARSLGYVPDLKNPKTYNEKILWRKVFDRDPLLVQLSDKIEVRKFIAKKLGGERAKQMTTDLYGTYDRAEDVVLQGLPDHYVVKANHGYGWNAFITPDSPLEEDVLRTEMARWLRRSHGRRGHQWAYIPIKRKIMVEEMIRDAEGNLANDIKFAVFNGKCRFIVYCDDRFGVYSRHHITPDWDRIFSHPEETSKNPLPEKPARFDEMLAVAEEISKGHDFFRVDFLFADDRFALNEITLYDADGMDPMPNAPKWDQQFGEFWTLPDRP